MLKNTNNKVLSALAKILALLALLVTSNITIANNCAYDYWTDGQWYDTGDTVEYDGDIYAAVYDNPGYHPVISSWFWDWQSTAGTCSYQDSDDNSCVDNDWIDGQWYNRGDKVKYNGTNYIAVVGNPGYNPTISTYFWDWHSTNDASCDQVETRNEVSGGDCGTQWHSANLTYYSSYPDPNASECRSAAECPWMGQFKGLADKKSEAWVKQNNIIAVHSRDYEWLKGKTLKIKQGSKEINATVYDECSDSDCNGCCSTNLGSENFLIDMEKNAMLRFGTYFGSVKWQICD